MLIQSTKLDRNYITLKWSTGGWWFKKGDGDEMRSDGTKTVYIYIYMEIRVAAEPGDVLRVIAGKMPSFK